jgi:Intra-flagellar transport protein 57.
MNKVKDYTIVSSSTMHSMEKVYNRLIFLQCPKQITRNEFLFPSTSSPNKQYNVYIEIIQWLLVLIDKQAKQSILLEVEQEYEDPNLIAHKLLDCLRSLNFTSDYPSIRVKQPFGEVACNILDFLTEKAILQSRVEVNQDDSSILEHQEENMDENVILTRSDHHHEEEEEQGLLPGVSSHTHLDEKTTEQFKESSQKTINTNLIKWRQELERVRPLLECSHSLENHTAKGQQSWRLLVNQIVNIHGDQFIREVKASELAFQRLGQDTASALSDIKSTEKAINDEFRHVVSEFDTLSIKVEDLQDKRQSQQTKLEKIGKDLVAVSQMLAEVKSKVDEKGNSITDTSQIIKTKTALNGMKHEIRSFDAEIAMLEHTLLHRKLQLRSSFLNQVET